jgi:hypothetical protein
VLLLVGRQTSIKKPTINPKSRELWLKILFFEVWVLFFDITGGDQRFFGIRGGVKGTAWKTSLRET